MIDTHAHINSDAFDDDRHSVINHAFESGVESIIIPAIEESKFHEILDLTRHYKKIYCGIGIHPHNASELTEESINNIRNFALNNSKVLAIGEIGLDYYYDFAPKDLQIHAFKSQIQLAKELDLPIIIHNRESDDDLLKVLKEEQNGKLKGVLHCFSSDEIVLQKAIDLGFHVSFTGNITFKKSMLSEVVKSAPNDRIMIETDSPYMTPVPNRGKRNQPSFVRLVAEKIAEIKEITFDEVIKMTTKNAIELFKIPIVFFLFIASSLFATAQDEDFFDEDYFEEETEEKVEWVNPYKKMFGIGPVIGTNTIIQTFVDDGQDISYEGIFALGGAFAYEMFDFLNLQAAYLYSKNTKIAEDFPDIPNAENIHQMYELTALFIPNPGNKINFFGGAGPTILINEYFQGIDNTIKSTEMGLNASVGFTFNQKIGKAGILNFNAEWRLNFIFGETELLNDPRSDKLGSVNVKTFFSIPRITLMFYPNF